MKRTYIPQSEVKITYETAIQCRDYESAKMVIKSTADRYGISVDRINLILNEFARKNNVNTICRHAIEKKLSELSRLISSNPENIAECCRTYVKRIYPELTKRGREAEFKKEVKRTQSFWNFHRKDSHVCFMTVSKKGKAIINGKNSSKVNENYSQGFFKSLRMRIVALFKHTF